MVFSPQRLREETAKRLLTYDQVARELGVAPATMSRWINGHFEPRFSVVHRMAEFFECDPLSFYDFQEPTEKAA